MSGVTHQQQQEIGEETIGWVMRGGDPVRVEQLQVDMNYFQTLQGLHC